MSGSAERVYKPVLIIGGLLVAGALSLQLYQKTQAEQPFVTSLPLTAPKPIIVKDVTTPDGKLNITLQTSTNSKFTNSYSLIIVDTQTNNRHTVYSGNLLTGETVTIPNNSWSPNNKYFFVKVASSASSTFFVFKADGTTWPDGSQYYDVKTLFNIQKFDLSLRDATGWADNTLLIILTNNPDNTNGPKFWFDTSSRSFIRLWR